jgi:ketosteroid isomerase-like protein
MAETEKNHLKDVIEAADSLFMQRFAAAQFAELADLYTSDGMVLPPNMDRINGREAIAGLWKAIFEMGVKFVKLETLETEDSEYLGIEIGLFELYSADHQLIDKGKYAVTWKLEEGTWKLHRDIFNSSLPAKK